MKPEVLAKLQDAPDLVHLTRAVLALCEPFGPVHSFRLIHNRRAARVACFIELEAPKQHAAMTRALGANGVGGAVCLDIPVRSDFASPVRPTPSRSAMELRRPTMAHALPQVT